MLRTPALSQDTCFRIYGSFIEISLAWIFYMAFKNEIVISLFLSSPNNSLKAKSFFGDIIYELSGVVILGIMALRRFMWVSQV